MPSETLTVARKMALKTLPRTLKRLVMDNGVRPTFVSVTLTAAPTASYSAYWRNKVVGLGTETKHKTEYEMGSDGEFNSSTEVEFSRVAASVSTKCGYMKSSASLTVTGLTEELAAKASSSPVMFEEVLAELVNTHEWGMAEEGPVLTVTEVKPEPAPYTLVDWLETCT